ELGTDGAPVMAIGGFSGGDPSPTLQQFIDDVHAGDIHYYIGNVGGDRGFGGGNSGGQNGGRAGNQSGDQGKGGGGFGGPGGRGANGDIANWVQQHYTSSTVDGYTVYDLTKPKS
ncbi:MAG: glycosyl transferase, partial [Sciscionella sp.]|nr:glycosyl transferase [Sciscionella sp.]